MCLKLTIKTPERRQWPEIASVLLSVLLCLNCFFIKFEN